MSAEVLYISHNGLTEPLGRRQVLPYIVGLARRGWRFSVISFEKPETADEHAVRMVAATLDDVGARWKTLTYHSRPRVLATVYDMSRGVWAASRSRHAPRLVHARSTVPAALAAVVSRRYRIPWLFDVRGLIASEYADAGHWRRGGILMRVTDSVEQRLLRSASAHVFLTKRIARELVASGSLSLETPREVVPCMVDLSEFRPDAERRRLVRERLGLQAAKLLVYAGSLGSWYRIEEMTSFFVAARRRIEGLRFLVLTPQVDAAWTAGERGGVTADMTVLSLPPERVPEHLAAADVGICFLGDLVSKRAPSPTKYGEYLASGLPVITNRWTGDAEHLDGMPTWILVDRFEPADYERAAERVAGLLARPDETRGLARTRCARVQRRNRDRALRSPLPARLESGTVRVLALVPYPLGRAPGQRYRIEQWAPYLAEHGVEVTFAPFADAALGDVLYRPGLHVRKATLMCEDSCAA